MELGGILLDYVKGEWVTVDQYHTYVCPKVPVQPGVPHNIDADDPTRQPFENIKDGFEAFLARARNSSKRLVIAAHNGKRYDHRILYFHGINPPKDAIWGDTIEWFKSRRPNQKSYSVAALHPGGPPPAAHRALPDCEAVLRIMNAIGVRPCDAKGETWNVICALQ